MISKFAAAKQIERMSGLDYFQILLPAAVEELVIALCSAPDELVAAIVVTIWLADHKQRPTPADLYFAIERHTRAEIIAIRTESIVPWVSFKDWIRVGNDPDWDVFFKWVMGDTIFMPRKGNYIHEYSER